MAAVWDNVLRTQLLERRERLRATIPQVPEAAHLVGLLQEVDATLERIDHGSFGICQNCQTPIEDDRLLADPLTRTCLSCLTDSERHALEQDLDLAARIQSGLLPHSRNFAGWEVCFHYQPAGPVSGDYCDLVGDESDPGAFYFLLGDISGKGVAASLLMSHLHAIFRSLIAAAQPVERLIARANRVFCESTVPTHYATLICGHATTSGEVVIANAGHCPPLVLGNGGIDCVEATGLPIGLFPNAEYGVKRFHLDVQSSILLYTDGLTETQDGDGRQFSEERLRSIVAQHSASAPQRLLSGCVRQAEAFRGSAPRHDDITLLAIQRVPAPVE